MNENEVWRDIEGYEGMYQVSDKGRVRSMKFGKVKILKPSKDGGGYIFVYLCKNGKKKMCKIHRLVAQAFIHNTNSLPQINHKDEDKTNNKVENLEWCSAKYNNNFGTRIQRVAEKMTNGKLSKPVLQYTKDGKLVREWKSLMDVQRNLGYDHTNISACCLGRYKWIYGFVWKYKN